MKEDHDLLRDNATVKVLEWFSRNPSTKIYVNELSRTAQLSNASCSRILKLLEAKGFLEREEMGRAHYYRMKDNFATRETKRFFLILRLHESGLIEYLSSMGPSLTNLVLYGSCATGEFDENSDIDILAITNSRIMQDIEPFQEFLEKRIEITSMNIGRWISMKESNDGFYQEVSRDGIPLFGGDLP